MNSVSRRYQIIISALLILIILVVIGTIFFKISENWSYIDSFYFSVLTVTTVGYGDFVPTHNLSKIIATIYAMVGIPIAFVFFGVITEYYIETRMSDLEKRIAELLKKEEILEDKIKNGEEK